MDPNGDDPETHPFQPPSRKRARASASSYVDVIASGSNGGMSPEIDPEVEHKRKKARERQRRKRERDRSMGQQNAVNAGLSIVGVGADGAYDPSLVGSQEQTQQVVTQTPSGLVTPLGGPTQAASLSHAASQALVNITPEEAARKEKIRSAARERQRKHRAGIKAKRMAEAGLAPMDMLHVHGVGGGSLTVAGPPDAYHHRYQEHLMAQAHHHNMEHVGPEPPFQHLPTPAQTFANTLLLSFSCTPLLKQHLLRTLNMSNEDLASLEPLLAAAWEAWDRQRQQLAYPHGEPSPHNHTPPFLPPHHPHTHPLPHQQLPPGAPPGASEMHDFRTRFQRPLMAPSPFGRAPNGAEYARAPDGDFVRTSDGEDAYGRQPQSEETGIDPSLSKPDGEEDAEDVTVSEPGAVLLDADFGEPKEDDE